MSNRGGFNGMCWGRKKKDVEIDRSEQNENHRGGGVDGGHCRSSSEKKVHLEMMLPKVGKRKGSEGNVGQKRGTLSRSRGYGGEKSIEEDRSNWWRESNRKRRLAIGLL